MQKTTKDNSLPKVSIITASYNYEDLIQEAIQSVINQTYQNWEMIIVDDGSKDNSVEVIKQYCEKDERIKLFTHENNENKGLIKTLQLGIEKANGEYVVFLESDDSITENYIDEKLEIFSKYPNVGLVYNNINFFGNEKYFCNKALRKINNYWEKHYYPHKIYEQFYLGQYILTFSCVMLKKDLLKNLNFDSPKPAWVDLWLYAQISSKTEFYYLKNKLTNWRRHDMSYLHTDYVDQEAVYKFYMELYKLLPPIKSLKNKVLFFYKLNKQRLKYFIWKLKK